MKTIDEAKYTVLKEFSRTNIKNQVEEIGQTEII